MKKLLFIIPFILFSCVESELYIPGENLGEIDGIETEDPVKTRLLIEYNSNFPENVYSIKLENGENLSIIGENIITKRNDLIRRIKNDLGIFDFYYTGSDLTSIKNTNTGHLLTIQRDNNNITAIEQNGSNEIAKYSFMYYSDYIMSYNKKLNSGEVIATEFNYNGKNVSNIRYEENNIVNEELYRFSYDTEENPIKPATQEDFNTLMFFNAFINDLSFTPAFNQFTLLINNNNINQIQFNNKTHNINYIYGTRGPIDATVKNLDGVSTGTLKYTYKD